MASEYFIIKLVDQLKDETCRHKEDTILMVPEGNTSGVT